MRLTDTLFRSKYGFIFKLKWKILGNQKITDKGVPDAVLKHEIVEATEVVNLKTEQSKLAIPKLLMKTAKERLTTEDSQWKPRVCHICDNKTRLLEGKEQAQILTKTIVYEGLPPRVQKLVGKIAFSSKQDEILRRIIDQSTVSDGVQKLLPKKLDIKRPGWVFAREYGIRRARTVELLTRNLLRMLDNSVAGLEESSNRNIIRNCYVSVPIVKDGDQIQFSFKADLAVVDRQPLEPFADADEVVRESKSELPDIFPIKHTIDLAQTNTYELRNFFPMRNTAAHPYFHTIYLYQPHPYPKWLPKHVVARALTTSYAFTVAQARSIYGEDAIELERPVATQCVITDGREFSLVAFQLNTLTSDGRNGVKNMAWIETGFKLYEVSKEEDGKQTFEGYNPLVIDRLSAMHINGLSFNPRATLNYVKPSQ